jgi:hypothetical protein
MSKKVALICPTNLKYMPYVDSYKTKLDFNNIEFDLIYWNRNLEEKNDSVNFIEYNDKKNNIKRTFLDYYLFSKFVKLTLKKDTYRIVVIFTLPLIFFFQFYFKNKKTKFILDIRDYHFILKFFNLKKLVNKSEKTIISSNGFLRWLPKSSKYMINHNTRIREIKNNSNENINFDKKHIVISYIGQLQHYYPNVNFIKSLKNNVLFELRFVGKGTKSDEIIKYCYKNKINNVKVFGQYSWIEEPSKYFETDLVNLILDNKNLNNKTCLANRLYNGVYYFKPLIIYGDTYMSDIIKKYSLGLVLNKHDLVPEKIIEYINSFDIKKFEKGRFDFFYKVINENLEFENFILLI